MAILTKPEATPIEDLIPYEESKDSNRLTHIVNPPGNLHIWRIGMTAQDVVNAARLLGKEVSALCGYRWVPAHDPELFDVCPACMTKAGFLISGEGTS